MFETLIAMDPLVLGTFMAASIALYLTPGADMLFIVASGAAGGRNVGIAAALGVSIGSFFHTILAVIGVAALIEASEAAYMVLRYVGAAYLIYLAIKAWRAPPPALRGEGAARLAPAFLRGMLTNLLNPKVVLFVLAFLPQFTDPAVGPIWQQMLILGAIFSIASIPFNCSYGFVAGYLGVHLRRLGRVMNRVSALVFGGLAARLVWE